jgi:hypothetical protein
MGTAVAAGVAVSADSDVGVTVTSVGGAGIVAAAAVTLVGVGATVGRGDSELPHPSISQPTNNSKPIRAEASIEKMRRILKATSQIVFRLYFGNSSD